MQKRTRKILITILVIVIVIIAIGFIRGAVILGVINGSHSSAWQGEPGEGHEPFIMDDASGGGGGGALPIEYLITAIQIFERGWR